MDLAKFKAACQAGITRDNILVVRCSLFNGETITKQIDLQPIIDRIAHAIRHYHSRVLHGEMSQDTISGIGDWMSSAVDAAKRIAHSKAAKEIYEVVKSKQKEIATAAAMATLGPAGAAAVQTAYKAYDALKAAKAGDPVATEKVATVRKMADEGHPSAMRCLNMMRAMNRMMAIKEEKAPVMVSGWFMTRALGIDHPHHPDNRRKRSRRRKMIVDHRRQIAYEVPQDDGYGYQDQVSGWLYNRPYRGAVAAALQGSPGLGMGLRHLYETGASL